MGVLSFITTTIPSVFKRKETLLYPAVKKEPYPGQKGMITIDESKCILCGKCAKSCPADAILVSRDEKSWKIDHFRCITCSSCIEGCPKKCLTMDPHYTPVARTKHFEEHSINLPEKPKKETATEGVSKSD